MTAAASAADLHAMDVALRLARRGLGNVWPNPAVGCVLVAGDPPRTLGRGWTRPGGRPHAETEAIAQARSLGQDLAGATAYVTLEPCDHHGQTPPCSEALIAAGIGRVVVACGDPDKRVAGRGIARLREAGIAVATGIREAEARALNRGYLLRQEAGRPLVTLKTATSLDGRIATASGRSRWITGAAARARGHLLRACHDAIAVGVHTALADDPELTCRLPGGVPRPPARVVFDSRLRLPLTAKLVAGARQTPTWILTLAGNPADRVAALRGLGVEVLEIPADAAGGRVDPAGALAALAAKGITRLLLEGGGELSASFLAAGLVDEVAWFRAPGVIGGDGRPAAAGLGLDDPAAAPRFHRTDLLPLDDDVLETYVLRP